MSLGPILSGRLPNSLAISRSTQSLQSQNIYLQQLQDQLSTGQRFQLPGEEPAHAIRTVVLQSVIERNEQINVNTQQNQSFLSATDSALNSIGDIFDQAKGIILSGVGDSVTDAERDQLATEVGTLIDNALNTANTKHSGRYIFAGTDTGQIAFERSAQGIRYNGDLLETSSFIGVDSLIANNVNPDEAFRPFAKVQGVDVDPSLATSAKLSSLRGGDGISDLGPIEVTINIGAGNVTEKIDLTGADTIQDIITRLEAPFGGALNVALDAASGNGLELSINLPDTGTVAVTDIQGSNIAKSLGIESTAVATINGTDLNPTLSLQTTLASLNNGTGIGTTAGNGLLITQGTKSEVVDLNGLTTVEDLFNEIKLAGFDVSLGFTEDGSGLEISSRVSGANFSIGENGGNNATLLGIRTLTADTELDELNGGLGVHRDGTNSLDITRRDGTELEIDLSATRTIQDVLDTVNAIDPGVLVATLNSTGNGITINDSGAGGLLVIEPNQLAQDLGLQTFSETTALADLNEGAGVSNESPNVVTITQRDGAIHNLDLSSADTVQDVIDAINALDPGVLVASLSTDGTNGFSIADSSVGGSLIVDATQLAVDLGIDGTEATGTAPLIGDDVNAQLGLDNNPQNPAGIFDILSRLQTALINDDNAQLQNLDSQMAEELGRFTVVRGRVGSRLKLLDNVQDQLLDENIQLRESLSIEFDADLTETITNLTNAQTIMQASLQVTSQTFQLSLFNFL